MGRSKNISWMPLFVISAAAFIGALDATFMNVSMSQVVIDLDTDVGTIQKMVSFYTLITASLLMISAKCQDIIGKRKIFLLGMIIYGIGDLIAALSPNATILFIGWSLLEGIGSALMGPALISIITGTYEGAYRTKALAVVSTMASIAVAFGPLFGGVVTTFLSWRYGFGFELIVVAFVLAQHRKIKDFPPNASRKDLDIKGSVLSVAGLLLLMIGVLQLTDKNIKLSVILVTAGIFVLLAFGIFELRYSNAGNVPLFDIRLLKIRNLRNGTLVRLLTSFVMAGTLFAISVFLLSVLKLSAFKTGLMLMPMTVGMLLASFIAPKMASKIGHRYTMILGFVTAIAGCFIMCNKFTPDAGFVTLLPGLLIYGVGLGFPSALSVDVPLATVPREAQNSCSGLVSTGQNLGLSMGTGIIGVVLILGAVSGLREAINTYTPLNLSYEEFRANANMYMQKMGNVDPLTLTVSDQSAYQQIISVIYQNAITVVMMVAAGLMVPGIILTLSLMDIKKQPGTYHSNKTPFKQTRGSFLE